MADNTFTHVCSHRLISPSSLSQPKAKLHACKSTHTQTPSCAITLFGDRDACSLQPGHCALKTAVCWEWKWRCVDMCVKGWRRGEGSWRTARRWRFCGGRGLGWGGGPPPYQTGMLEEQPHWLPLWSGADMEIWEGWIRKHMWDREMKLDNTQKGRGCYKRGVVREEHMIQW